MYRSYNQELKVGDKFVGAVNGTIFEITKIRQDRDKLGLVPDYILNYNENKKVNATPNLLGWLLKSGGLLKIN